MSFLDEIPMVKVHYKYGPNESDKGGYYTSATHLSDEELLNRIFNDNIGRTITDVEIIRP